MIKKLFIIVFIGMVLINFIDYGIRERTVEKVLNNGDTVEKLQAFSEVEKDDEKYCFDYNGEWKLTYFTDNEFVTFKEDAVINCFESWFWEGCLSNRGASAGGFSYDLDENEIRIYCDIELKEGNLTIISYDMEKKKFALTIIGRGDYEPSDELLNWIDECDLAAIMEKDIEQFFNILKENGISREDVVSLKYDDVKIYVD